MKHPITRRHVIKTIGAATGVAVGGSAFSQNAPKKSGEILIGQSCHLTGPLAPVMKPVLEGQECAIDEFNRKGGAKGRPVRLIMLDDAYDPKKCVENVKKLIDEDKVVALYGLANTASVLATLPILSEKKVPLIGVYTGAPAVRAKHHPYFFTTMASYRDEVVQMVRNLVTLQKTRVAVGYMNAPFGQLMKPVVEEVIKEQGATLVAMQPFDNTGSDAVTCIQAMVPGNPQAVLFIGFGPALVPFTRAAKANLGVPIYSLTIGLAKLALDALGDDARGLAFTQLIPYPYRQTTQLTREFAEAVKPKNYPADWNHMFGYWSTRILLESIRLCGKNVTSANIVKSMERMTNYNLGGYTLNYGPNQHSGFNAVTISVYGPGGRWLL